MCIGRTVVRVMIVTRASGVQTPAKTHYTTPFFSNIRNCTVTANIDFSQHDFNHNDR